MRQHARFKQAHPGCLLFLRMVDFYELFLDDAVTSHKALAAVALRLTPTIPAPRTRTTRA
jgi:DNA mismatch repair protein MutS